MSLYNMINGFNPACLLIMPMLGRKQEEWPRFRDCFVTNEKNIAIYTRAGGGNRGCGYGEEELYKDPNFIKEFYPLLAEKGVIDKVFRPSSAVEMEMLEGIDSGESTN